MSTVAAFFSASIAFLQAYGVAIASVIAIIESLLNIFAKTKTPRSFIWRGLLAFGALLMKIVRLLDPHSPPNGPKGPQRAALPQPRLRTRAVGRHKFKVIEGGKKKLSLILALVVEHARTLAHARSARATARHLAFAALLNDWIQAVPQARRQAPERHLRQHRLARELDVMGAGNKAEITRSLDEKYWWTFGVIMSATPWGAAPWFGPRLRFAVQLAKHRPAPLLAARRRRQFGIRTHKRVLTFSAYERAAYVAALFGRAVGLGSFAMGALGVNYGFDSRPMPAGLRLRASTFHAFMRFETKVVRHPGRTGQVAIGLSLRLDLGAYGVALAAASSRDGACSAPPAALPVDLALRPWINTRDPSIRMPARPPELWSLQ